MKVTVTLRLSDHERRALTERMPADTTPYTRQGMATRAAIEAWLSERVQDEVDEWTRVHECATLGCSDSDDDHDHWVDGPKGYE